MIRTPVAEHVAGRSPSAKGRHSRALLRLVAVLLGLWTFWSTLILPRLPPRDGFEHTLQSVGVRLLLWILPCGVYLFARYRRDALAGLRLGLPPTARHWAQALAIIVLASLAVSLDVARKLELPPAQVWWLLVERFELHFPTSEVFEELIFRGVILSELLLLFDDDRHGERSTFTLGLPAWKANALASVIFTGLHWPWWIFTGGITVELWTKTAGVFLISVVLGMLFVRARSLWPCVVLHVLNNALSTLAG